MDQSFRKDHLMLESFNPGLTREEIAKIIEPFGPIKNIITYRQVVNNMMYNFSLAIIHFETKEGYEKALHSDTSLLGLRFIEIDPFFIRPYVAFIFGLPPPGNLAVYTKIFSPLGAKDIRMIEKATCKDDYIIVSTFDNKYAFRNFIKIVDKSYMSGNLLRVFPFSLSKTNPTYSTSMPYLQKSIDNEEFFDFKLIYYDKEYKCWSGSAIANCNVIAEAYNQFLIEKGENPNQEDSGICSVPINNIENVSENEKSKNKKEKESDSPNNSDDSEYNEKDNSSDEVIVGDESDSDKDESSTVNKNSDDADNEKISNSNDNKVDDDDNDDDNDSKNQITNKSANSTSEDNDYNADNNNNDDMTEFIVPEIPGPFELIVDYINGKSIQLSDTNAPFIMLMSEKLGMVELYHDSKRFVYECSDLESNAIMLAELYELNGNITPLLSIVANKFEEICDSLTVRRYPMELIEMLISSPFFSMQDEDKLFEYIQEFKKTDSKKYQYLLKQVRIERLSSVELLKIVSDPTVDLNTLREGLMLQMKVPRKEVKISPLIGSAAAASKNSDNSNGVRYPNPPKNMKSIFGDSMSFGDIFRSECYKKEGDQIFNGIFAALKNQANGQNPALAGLVSITASTEAHEHAYILAEYNQNIWFGTQDIENSFIRIDFKTRKVSLIGYSLKTHSHDGNGHITGWTLSGSNDNSTWDVIDLMPMTDQFDSLGAERYYQLNSETPFYQYFELKQSRQNTMGYHNLRLSSIEFFGSIQQ